MRISGADSRYDWLTLRGFSPVQFIDGLQSPIGATTGNTGTDLYGFEAVDILKGPSSVLYGLTPPGGIVNVRSRRPGDELGGELDLQYGNDDYKQIAGDITGPFGDRVSARLTGLYRDRQSQVDHVDIERTFVAPAVTIKFGENTQLTLLELLPEGRGARRDERLPARVWCVTAESARRGAGEP